MKKMGVTKDMELSKRLKAIASLVTPGDLVADIGTDHGYVPIYLVKQGICKRGLAMDIGEGPLAGARAHIVEEGVENQVEARRSDGLEHLSPGEADSIILAGMGGSLMAKILNEGSKTAHTVKEMILSPQSEMYNFRKYLHQNHYRIIEEIMLEEDGKYYTVMKVVPLVLASVLEQEVYSEAEYTYGKILLERRHPVLRSFLEKEFRTCEAIIKNLENQDTENARIRRTEVEAKRDGIWAILSDW